MKLLLVTLLVGLAAAKIDLALETQCQEWVVDNMKDLVLINQIAGQSHIASCQQYCMIAGSGFRADTTNCRSLCERAGGYQKFSAALTLDDGTASPISICDALFAEAPTPVSFLETAQDPPAAAASQRRLGVRGDVNAPDGLSCNMLRSPVGDVKVSGDMQVQNSLECASTRTASMRAQVTASVPEIVSKKENLLIKGKIDAEAITADAVASSFLELGGVRQWALHSLEDFEEVGTDGWSHGEITECGGTKLLGGHCVQKGDTELSKTFTNLPPHTQLRVTAKYMFIDSWDGESGYLKVDGNHAWAETYNHADGDAKHGINMCGNPTPERKFGRPIDVTIPHTADSVTLNFGATTDEHPCDESFGIDSVMIFTR